ncbi:MAG: hypothetical protein EPN22_12965 [Nitrospirae bacterium]|nr:MAG: hypothetical protein EPN22_12965 [Nitrospirota bacterium]
MSLLRKIFDILSSKRLLFLLFGLWAAYYIVLSVWNQESFAHFVMDLKHKPLYQIPFVLFIVCGYLRIVADAAHFIGRGILLRYNLTKPHKSPSPSSPPLKGGELIQPSPLAGEGEGEGALLVNFLVFVIGRLMLPLGLMLFLTGFYISITERGFEWIMIAEGHKIKPAWSAQELTVRRIKPGIGEDRVDRKDNNLIFAHEPKVTVADPQMKLYDIGAFPPAKIGNTYMHILNFGLAPGLIISHEGDKKDEGYIPLRIISPGNSDTFNLPGHPYKIQMELIETIDITKPLYGIKVYKDEMVVKELHTRDLFEIDGITVEVKQPIFWVMIEAVKDHGVLFVIFGGLLVVIGGPLYFLSLLIERRIIRRRFIDSK